MRPQIELPTNEIAQVCRKYYVHELALFGSVLRDDFKPSSDIDLLVDFFPDAQIGFMAFSRMQRELTELLHRPVDLVSKNGLKPQIRQNILANLQVIYAA